MVCGAASRHERGDDAGRHRLSFAAVRGARLDRLRRRAAQGGDIVEGFRPPRMAGCGRRFARQGGRGHRAAGRPRRQGEAGHADPRAVRRRHPFEERQCRRSGDAVFVDGRFQARGGQHRRHEHAGSRGRRFRIEPGQDSCRPALRNRARRAAGRALSRHRRAHRAQRRPREGNGEGAFRRHRSARAAGNERQGFVSFAANHRGAAAAADRGESARADEARRQDGPLRGSRRQGGGSGGDAGPQARRVDCVRRRRQKRRQGGARPSRPSSRPER